MQVLTQIMYNNTSYKVALNSIHNMIQRITCKYLSYPHVYMKCYIWFFVGFVGI